MPDPEIASPSNSGLWAAATAAITTLGTLALTRMKAKPVNQRILEALAQLKEETAVIKQNMATRSELADLHHKIDRHVEAHAAQSFKG